MITVTVTQDQLDSKKGNPGNSGNPVNTGNLYFLSFLMGSLQIEKLVGKIAETQETPLPNLGTKWNSDKISFRTKRPKLGG